MDYIRALENRAALASSDSIAIVDSLLNGRFSGQSVVNTFYVDYFKAVDVCDQITSKHHGDFAHRDYDRAGHCDARDRPRIHQLHKPIPYDTWVWKDPTIMSRNHKNVGSVVRASRPHRVATPGFC